MIENIARYVEQGDTPMEAALKGSQQIGFTIISLTISLIAVLIPLLFMGDVVGRLFREFAITLAVTILISAVVSLTLVPMMCAKLVRHHTEEEIPAWSRKAGAFFDGGHQEVRRGAHLGAGPPDAHALGRGGHLCPDCGPLHHHPEGILPRAGHRAHPVDHGGLAGRVVRRDGGPAEGRGRRRAQGPGRGKAFPPSSASTARTRRSTAAGCS